MTTTKTIPNSSSALEAIRDAIAAALVPGSGIDITVNDAANTITITATGGGGGGGYTDQMARDAIVVYSGGAVQFSTRTVAIAATILNTATILQTDGYSAVGDSGAAKYKKVGSQPSHLGKFQSADGAWWELSETDVTPQMFGAPAVGTSGYDDIPAFRAALVYLAAKSHNITPTVLWYRGANKLKIPAGTYYWSDTLELKDATFYIEGPNHGLAHGGFSVEINVAASKTGIITHRTDTTGQTTAADTQGADNTTIKGIRLVSAGGSGNFDGIQLRSAANLINLTVEEFPRDCYHLEAQSGGGGSLEGHINSSYIENCLARFARRHGFFIDGADANAMTFININATYCAGWGIYDSSFLGNTYIGSHVRDCGMAYPGKITTTAMITYGSNWYSVVPGQVVAAATTTPGTNSAIWFDMGPGTVNDQNPLWTNGMTTLIEGGAYRTDNGNASNTFIGLYTESGQPAAYIVDPTIVVGGLQGALVRGAGRFLSGTDEMLGPIRYRSLANDSRVLNLTMRSNGDRMIRAEATGDGTNGIYFLRWFETERMWGSEHVASGTYPFMITTDISATGYFGRTGSIPAGHLIAPAGVFLGTEGSYSPTGSRFMGFASAAPTTGYHAKGETIFNNGVTGGNDAIDYWRCTTAGTPGTWTARP